MHDDATAIPAATIADVDLSGIAPEAAAEIRRLGGLMERGDETPEQFAGLLRLLHGEGFVEKAEYLLRRNVAVVHEGAALYRELFGTERPDQFLAAIEKFRHQFTVTLQFVKEVEFLEHDYQSMPSGNLPGRPRVLRSPCEVRFDYADETTIGAEAFDRATDEYESFRWDGTCWVTSARS